jgi:hypothetical protein
MAGGDRTIKIYHRIAKKRYLKGKYMYKHLRIYVPIPGRFHKIIKPFLKQRLKIKVTAKNDGLLITLHPTETFQLAESHKNNNGNND